MLPGLAHTAWALEAPSIEVCGLPVEPTVGEDSERS